MSTYAEYFVSLLPTWLRDPYGRAWGGVYGAAADTAVAVAKDAIHAGNVLDAPDDALPRLGADTLIERLPDEDADTHRARITGAWETWPWAGTRTALETVAAQLDFHGVVVRTAREWGMADASTRWARWWVIVTLGDPWIADGTWGDPGDWDDGGTWDSDASVESVATVRRLFRRFSNARDQGFVRFVFDENVDFWGPDEPWDHGTWDDPPASMDWRI